MKGRSRRPSHPPRPAVTPVEPITVAPTPVVATPAEPVVPPPAATVAEAPATVEPEAEKPKRTRKSAKTAILEATHDRRD